MSDLSDKIVAHLRRKGYKPLKPRELAKKLGVSTPQYPEFRRALRELIGDGRIEVGKNQTIRQTAAHGTITGSFRRAPPGTGFVRPPPVEGKPGPDIRIREDHCLAAATGDGVLVKIVRKPNRPDMLPAGQVMRVL